MPRTVTVTRYVAPLREGGSLPAIVEADDDGLYVLKFRGAGQGPKALIAELVAGEIGRALGLAVPELVFARLDPALGRSEPDSDIRDLIQASGGLNLALDYLPGSIAYDPQVRPRVESALASEIVWFDAYVWTSHTVHLGRLAGSVARGKAPRWVGWPTFPGASLYLMGTTLAGGATFSLARSWSRSSTTLQTPAENATPATLATSRPHQNNSSYTLALPLRNDSSLMILDLAATSQAVFP
jgi:hypothetical protein